MLGAGDTAIERMPHVRVASGNALSAIGSMPIRRSMIATNGGGAEAAHR
jgi:hypothetical protein